MAQKVSIELIDDLDGSTEAHETVVFGLDGTGYEIDLSKRNADKLRKALEPFTAAGRRTGRLTGKPGRRVQIGPSSAEVRAWARDNGIEVPEKGRVPQAVADAFSAAR